MGTIKDQIKSWLKVSDIPIDRWRVSEGLLDSSCLRAFRLRLLAHTSIRAVRSCLRIPLWLVRLPFQVMSLLHEFETLHFSPMRRIRKGAGCVIDRQTWLINGQNIELGNFVKLSAYSSLMAGNTSTISIGSNTIISTGVVVVSFNHGYSLNGIPMRYQPWIDLSENSIVIGNDVWIGANVTILPGSRVGDGAIIGAGATVRGTIPPNTVYLANLGGKIVPRNANPPQRD